MGTDTGSGGKILKYVPAAALLLIFVLTTALFEHAYAQGTEQSLAKRLCGKYSYHVGGEENEFYTMNVISFGDNVYALCARAVTDDYESFETYSFRASEFIPYEVDDMKKKDSDKVRVNVLSFSVMSNTGKYQGEGSAGTITSTQDGLLFEDFKDDEFLCPAEYGSRLFLKDDRVEEVFPYLNDGEETSGDDNLTGLWMFEDVDGPVFLEFQDSNLFVYQKESGTEVFYAAGAYTCCEGMFTGVLSVLGNGSMPMEIYAEYAVSKDTLSAVFGGDVPSALEGNHLLKRAETTDIPVTVMDEAGAGDCYAVFAAAALDKSSCMPVKLSLEEAGFDSCVIFTPEFTNLNPEPFYAVTAGLFGTEKEALDCLRRVKAAGFNDAYVKFIGEYTGHQ